jgi:hypothetical protein
MDRGLAAALLVVVVVMAGVAPLVAATTTTETPGDSTDVSPGQRLAAAVGSQATELKGEMSVRVLETRFSEAQSNASKATLLAETLSDVEERIEELQARQDRLAAQYENGTMSFGEYAARTAQLVAKERVLTRLLDVSERQAKDLPEAVLNERGVSLEGIAELREMAGNASGQAISEIAREIAGPPVDVENRTQGGPDADTGGEATSAIKSAAGTVRSAERKVASADRLVSGGEAAETLGEARTTLSEAKDALEAARDAAEDGNADDARELAATAEELAEEARDLAEMAREQAEGEPGQGENTRTDSGGGPPEIDQGTDQPTGTQAA